MSIQDLIAEASERLTPTDRRIASAVLEEPTLLAFGTVSDLASRVDTSRPSIVRFATRLGFGGYTDLQNWARDQVSEQLSSPSQRIRRGEGEAASARAAIEGAVAHAFAHLDIHRLNTLAAPIARAPRVWILTGETSMAGAHALHSGLSMARPGVTLLQEHATGRDLTCASPDDAAVVFDFERYRNWAITTSRTLVDIGVTLVAITDGPLSPLAALTPHWCELKIPAVGPFDSSVPAVLAAELLVSRVVAQRADDARERIDRLESLWHRTGTFLEYRPKEGRTL
ncbi:MAG: MurR/RpiR family transcriptional regulator [Phycisphaerales bacterium]